MILRIVSSAISATFIAFPGTLLVSAFGKHWRQIIYPTETKLKLTKPPSEYIVDFFSRLRPSIPEMVRLPWYLQRNFHRLNLKLHPLWALNHFLVHGERLRNREEGGWK